MGSFVQLQDNNQNTIIPLSPAPLYEVDTTQTGGVVSGLSLEPYYMYYFTTQLTSLDFSLGNNPNSDYDAEYFLAFESGATPTTVTWPQGLVFANSSSAPTIVDNAHYEISIRDNLCIVQVFGVNTGGGGGGGSVTFDVESATHSPEYGSLRDNGVSIITKSPKPIINLNGPNLSQTLDDGYIYVAGALDTLDFVLGSPISVDYEPEYRIIFESGGTPTIVNWPSGLVFDDRPVIKPDSYNEIVIVGVNVKCYSYKDITNYGVTPPISGGSDVDFAITDNTLTPNFGILQYQTNDVLPFSSVPYKQMPGPTVVMTLEPGKIYVAGELSDLDFGLDPNPYPDYLAIYSIRFVSGATPTNVTWPGGILFKDGVIPIIDANKTYEINIIDNLCVVSFYA